MICCNEQCFFFKTKKHPFFQTSWNFREFVGSFFQWTFFFETKTSLKTVKFESQPGKTQLWTTFSQPSHPPTFSELLGKSRFLYWSVDKWCLVRFCERILVEDFEMWGLNFPRRKAYSWVANTVQREIPLSKFVGWSDLFFPSKRRRRYNGKCCCSPPFKFQPRKSELQICCNGNTRPCKSLGCSPRMLVTRTTILSQVSRIPMNLHLPLLLGEVSHHSCIFWNSIHYPFLQPE